MARLLFVLTAACALVAAATPSASARAAGWQECGAITVNGRVQTLQVKGISCYAGRGYAISGAPAGWQCGGSALVCWRGSLRSDPEHALQAFQAFPAKRYVGYVGGVNGPGHHFYVGDGIYLTFGAPVTAPVRYRVCWGLAGHLPTRCAFAAVRSKASTSKIFIAPQVVGTWIARWYVGGRMVASWSWYHDTGD